MLVQKQFFAIYVDICVTEECESLDWIGNTPLNKIASLIVKLPAFAKVEAPFLHKKKKD